MIPVRRSCILYLLSLGQRADIPILEYKAFYEEHVFDKQQVHYQPISVSRGSGILIPGAGPLIPVGKTQDFAIQRKESQGPDVKVRCFTPEGEPPAGGWPALVYFHGGGWVLGNINTENVGTCED